MSKSNWREKLWLISVFCIRLGSYIFGLRSFTKIHIIFKIYICCWSCDIVFFISHTLLNEIHFEEFTLGGLMHLLLYLTQMIAHLVVLLESLLKDRDRMLLHEKILHVGMRLSMDMKFNIDEVRRNRNGVLCIIVALCILVCNVVHTMLSWVLYPSTVIVTSLYWHSLPSVLALQFSVLNVISGVAVLNEYAGILCLHIEGMGEHNLRRVFKSQRLLGQLKSDEDFVTRQRNEEDLDERMLNTLKDIFSNLYALYQAMNDCYGWSLLAFIIMYFIYFVVNSYFVLQALITQGKNEDMLIKNLGYVIIVVAILWVLCWQCQQSTNQSRQIGCIIYKLVKPMGLKSYNNLVIDFALQTLHQQLVITVKNFFDLNLSLLGSMVAAIVTYLVILIQFMLEEKTKIECIPLQNMTVNNM